MVIFDISVNRRFPMMLENQEDFRQMADMQIISETPINIYHLKKELERMKKRDNELNFRANRTEEYLNQIAVLKNADELFRKIISLNIPRLKEQHVHKIIDITPITIN